MATWRLRRLYHQEVDFQAYEMRFLDKLNSEKKLDNHTLSGMAVNAGSNALTLVSPIEARLERTFHRALTELKRLRSRRRKDLALVCTTAPKAEPKRQQLNKSTTYNSPPPILTSPIPRPTPLHRPKTASTSCRGLQI
jgi:hypothetical protein